MTAPPRRWFRWSLRTMFVVVTVFGIWLGWQLKCVRDRESLRAEILARGDSWIDITPAKWQIPGGVPLGWRMFGAQPVATIWIKNKYLPPKHQVPFPGPELAMGAPEELAIRRAFPEAYIFVLQEQNHGRWVVDDPCKGIIR